MKRAAVIGGTNCIGNNTTLTPLYSEYDILIVSYLSCNMLAEAALGIENEITKALINDKPVYVSESGLRYKSISNKALFEKYNSYFKTLISYGVKLINCTEDVFLSKNHKKLLTVADLSSLNSGTVTLGKETIVTPLALDYAKENNITIIRSDTI